MCFEEQCELEQIKCASQLRVEDFKDLMNPLIFAGLEKA